MSDKIIEKINTILQSDSLKNIYSNYFKDKLQDKVVKISIVDITLELYIKFKDENMTLSIDENQQDVEISGTLSSFIFYSAVGGNELYSSKINISGDVETANSLNSLFKETDLLRGIIMEVIGQKSIIFTGKADRDACGARAASTTNAVDVILRVLWQVVVHHVRDTFNVDPAPGNIRRDHDF